MRVLWLGGSACAGKTSVARRLAAQLGLTLYSCDDRFEAHRRRADPVRHPHFHHLMDAPMEELWAQPADRQAAELLRFYEDEMEMVFADLRDLPGPVLAEGAGLLPGHIAALPEPRALWLIATPAFRRRVYPERGPFVAELLRRCPDPEAAFARWMERDDLVARHLSAEAHRHGMPVIEVDGTQSLDEITERCRAVFGERA
jgi:2-phosphoglycerate kinase